MVNNSIVVDLEPSQTKTMTKLNLSNEKLTRKNNGGEEADREEQRRRGSSLGRTTPPRAATHLYPFHEELQFHLLLEVVELSENALTGTVESWFFLLSSLQQVDLANNTFTGVQILRPLAMRAGGSSSSGRSNPVALNLRFNKIQGYVKFMKRLFLNEG